MALLDWAEMASEQTKASDTKVEEELTLEEDDLFEEFEDQVVDEVGKEQLWQATWEDDDTHEDFAQQLKLELSQNSR